MSKHIGPACRLCRREQKKLELKSDKCFSGKCPLEGSKSKKPRGTPGMTSKFKRRLTDYGVQLREKQILKRYYLLTETQFSGYVKKAQNFEGITAMHLFRLLESRFDVVVYRLGIGHSKKHARQLIGHGYFLVNKKKVNIPSYIIKPGDVIEFRKEITEKRNVKDAVESIDEGNLPAWLKINKNALTFRMEEAPKGEDIKTRFFPELRESLIVEFYSR